MVVANANAKLAAGRSKKTSRRHTQWTAAMTVARGVFTPAEDAIHGTMSEVYPTKAEARKTQLELSQAEQVEEQSEIDTATPHPSSHSKRVIESRQRT
eukprot:225495-Amphidinium_carterae.2